MHSKKFGFETLSEICHMPLKFVDSMKNGPVFPQRDSPEYRSANWHSRGRKT